MADERPSLAEFVQECQDQVKHVIRPMVTSLLNKDRGSLSDASLKAIRTEIGRQVSNNSRTHLKLTWMATDDDARSGNIRTTVIPTRPWQP